MNVNPYLILGVSVILVMVFYILIIALWFYQRRQDMINARLNAKISEMLNRALELAESDKKKAYNLFCQFVDGKSSRVKVLIKIIADYGDDKILEKHGFFTRLYKKSGIKKQLIKDLSSNNDFVVSAACRYVGELHITGMEENLLELVEYANGDVIYNILLSLSKLGSKDGVKVILTQYEKRLNLSNRAIVEILECYTGSKEDLIISIIDLCNNYIRGIIIKAAASYKFSGMKEYYIKYMGSEDKNLKIACIRALSSLKDYSVEEQLIASLYDKEWEVRAAAAKELEQVGSSLSFPALEKAISDSEWWVRRNAANTLVVINGGREYAAKIIHGSDRYAKDAIRYAMETNIKYSVKE